MGKLSSLSGDVCSAFLYHVLLKFRTHKNICKCYSSPCWDQHCQWHQNILFLRVICTRCQINLNGGAFDDIKMAPKYSLNFVEWSDGLPSYPFDIQYSNEEKGGCVLSVDNRSAFLNTAQNFIKSTAKYFMPFFCNTLILCSRSVTAVTIWYVYYFK